MTYRKIINLSGRYKFVRDACEDIYDYALSIPNLEGKYKYCIVIQERLILH